ncbi:beta-1,3-glucan-binding protein [Culex quinquefasciatus]|uniref:beta-1,3-glucan-binding protein n=1 Tax=Culex quinquefasciatus TaxID=7176 RepID=UPI0018E2A36F|nr:beta-1,3-glucan-binding protein [Culex quinquefasciatus]
MSCPLNITMQNDYLITLLVLVSLASICLGCRRSSTTVSGSKAPKGRICKNQLIFEDNFNQLDRSVWKHENSVAGGGNWEFQWYSGSDRNSYAKDGKLFIRPTLTADEFGEDFLTSGSINLNQGSPSERCTDDPGFAQTFYGCERSGSYDRILNPIRSARLRTKDTFAFKYGKLEIRAKLPAGDWLWPAMWMFPQQDSYGVWPKSGEIDLVESRGNRELYQDGKHIGVKWLSSCLHFGESWNQKSEQCGTHAQGGLATQFNNYEMTWTKDVIQFGINGVVYRTVTPYEGFGKLGGFGYNPWPQGSKMAPFDKEFFLVVNVAVGGNFFPDNVRNPHRKPWYQGAPSAMTDFYKAKSDWLSTWDGDDAALQVDYVKVWAV